MLRANGSILKLKDVSRVELGAVYNLTGRYNKTALAIGAYQLRLKCGRRCEWRTRARLKELGQKFPHDLTSTR